jgi:Bifunctional DNA primase/polymerase, N-terminal
MAYKPDAPSPLHQALNYASRGWPVFPCVPYRKAPLTRHGFKDATTDTNQIKTWWRRAPNALIATPTGRAFGQVVLDVDVKHANQDGRRTLHELGTILPATPRAHTPSGGVHIHFDPAGREIVSTVGAQGRGIGAGLDWRAELASIILPTPGTGYRWDTRYNLDTVPLAQVPEALLPRPPRQAPDPANAFWQRTIQEGVREQSRYAAGALARAAHRIANAPNGQQEWTLNSEALGLLVWTAPDGIKRARMRSL